MADKENWIWTSPEEDIDWGEREEDISLATSYLLSSIAKTLLDIREELRRMNGHD